MLYHPTGPSDPPRPPQPAAKERSTANDDAFLDSIANDPSPSRRQIRVRNLLLFVAAAVVLAELFRWWGGIRPTGRPLTLMLETALGAASIAAVAVWTIAGRGRSMVGRSTTVLGIAGLATPLLLFLWKIGTSAQFQDALGIGPMGADGLPRAGWRCLRLSIALGLAPLIAMVLVRRNSDPNHPRLTGATLGIAASACAWVFTDLWCPVGNIPHLLRGHLLPMAILAALGAALGHLLISVRAPAR